MPQVNRTAGHRTAAQRHRADFPGRKTVPGREAVSGRTIGLGPLTGLSGFVLRLAQLAVFSDFIAACRRFDIRPAQYSVLTVIESNPGINQTELSGVLAIKRANLVGLINGLERRGFVQRRRAARDRRAFGMFLTDRGTALMPEVHAAVRAHDRRITRRLGKGSRDQLLALLNDLIPDNEP
jgi:DNA-binding MarR family transcriptional regulator